MADYWGLEAIAARMGAKHVTTLYRLYEAQRFLMFQRYKILAPGTKPRRLWYTNDALILHWEVAQCGAQRRSRASRPKHRRLAAPLTRRGKA